MDVFSLFSIGLAFFVVAASPGPANISNATIAMSRGRRISLVYGVGLSAGLVFWGLIAASGLGVVLQNSMYLLMILKVLGGMYLIWLAYLSMREAISPTKNAQQKVKSSTSYLGWFAKGLMLNISNPKSVVAWMAALSIGLGSNDSVFSLFLGVMVCVVVGFIVNAMYSILFSLTGVMSWYQKVNRKINGIVSVIFVAGGVGLIRSAFNRSSMS